MHLIEQTACELLAQDQVFVLATIVRHEGATPRTAGSKMIVTREGRGIGTIGGGSLEAAVMARATQLIKQEQSEVMHFDLSGDVITAKDMICGGSADVSAGLCSPHPRQPGSFWPMAAGFGEKPPGVSGDGSPANQ